MRWSSFNRYRLDCARVSCPDSWRMPAKIGARPGPASRVDSTRQRIDAESGFPRADDGLGARGHVELDEHGGDLVAHGLLGQSEMCCDLQVVQAMRQQFKQSASARQRRPPPRDRPPRLQVPAAPNQGLTDRIPSRRTERASVRWRLSSTNQGFQTGLSKSNSMCVRKCAARASAGPRPTVA